MSSLTKQELRIVASLASIFSLRMFGLCMLLPVFALEASKFVGSSEQLIGLVIGAYGLAQALLQIPFGVLSDRYGRKPVILFGLVLLLLGSLIAARATSIYGLIIGRLLQGSGAIGSVVIATLADHTREQVRTRSMAVLGASIGLAFVLAMVLGPWLNQIVGFKGIFNLTALLAIGGIALLVFAIPKTSDWQGMPNLASFWQGVFDLKTNYKLFNLNVGIFVLHASLSALFLVLPLLLQQVGFLAGNLWQLYLGSLLCALLIAVKLITISERQKKVDKLLIISISSMLVSEVLLSVTTSQLGMFICLSIFFTAFCILEASLPTLVAKYASANNRGAALGVYSSLQFLGIFFGGMIGGWVHGHFGIVAVLGFCMTLALAWLGITLRKKGLNYG